jgi:hypothetical protein
MYPQLIILQMPDKNDIFYLSLIGYNPDFDSKRGQKKAKIPLNK